ncbi:hypothetical protein L1987_01109 [Smallanthus sonchifolius]|uniref:Uncharacterized protein n=1 Tax=Smallanthus sonchifolius TaxID=185202 RepID=A0ACB9K464_9ASTR|nr:hypothetical protein L1987_01109 [Smallanthus sonchifolius]
MVQLLNRNLAPALLLGASTVVHAVYDWDNSVVIYGSGDDGGSVGGSRYDGRQATTMEGCSDSRCMTAEGRRPNLFDGDMVAAAVEGCSDSRCMTAEGRSPNLFDEDMVAAAIFVRRLRRGVATAASEPYSTFAASPILHLLVKLCHTPAGSHGTGTACSLSLAGHNTVEGVVAAAVFVSDSPPS